MLSSLLLTENKGMKTLKKGAANYQRAMESISCSGGTDSIVQK